MADHKYIRKEMRNGKWVYIYDDPDVAKSTTDTSDTTFTKKPLVTKKPVTTKKPVAAYNLKNGRTIYAQAAAVQMDSEPDKKRIVESEKQKVESKKLSDYKKRTTAKKLSEVGKREHSDSKKTFTKTRVVGSKKLSEIKTSSSIVDSGATVAETLLERLKNRKLNMSRFE